MGCIKIFQHFDCKTNILRLLLVKYRPEKITREFTITGWRYSDVRGGVGRGWPGVLERSCWFALVNSTPRAAFYRKYAISYFPVPHWAQLPHSPRKTFLRKDIFFGEKNWSPLNVSKNNHLLVLPSPSPRGLGHENPTSACTQAQPRAQTQPWQTISAALTPLVTDNAVPQGRGS